MVFKQSTFGEILNSEREMVLRGAELYGSYHDNALGFILLLSSGMIKSVDRDRFIFAIFLSHIKKHLTLSLFSALRWHKVQAMMNLRQVLEAGACAAYAIANTDQTDFVDVRDDGTLDPSQKLTTKRYAWLSQNFPDASENIKRMKDRINTIGTHANLVAAQLAFKSDFEAEIFNTTFFDYEDEMSVKTDLWLIANITLGLMDLFYGVNKTLGAIKLLDGWGEKFNALATENERLKTEMLGHERLKGFSAS